MTKTLSLNSDRSANTPNSGPKPAFQKILEALQGLRFGSVEITVHDGDIVQIERREKLRLTPDSFGSAHRAR